MAKKAKKRGVKPGTKRGPYKVAKRKRNIDIGIMPRKQAIEAGWKVGMDLADLNVPKYTPAQPLTLCGQLEDAILLLENRVSNAIAKINSLM